jgi:asparagine synthase (glutamine-hydrolysing)
MCGIAGYFNSNGEMVPKEPIESMLVTVRHRGPDGFGVYYGDRCILGHARLSILDLEGGWQPIFNEDDTLVVTYNGEIYNYLEIRNQLEGKGHRFYTKSDTEVIVHAFEEWKFDCPKKFNGQFAFAIWDLKDKSLFLCRDRLGVRPLFYTWVGHTFIFASEIKSILASGFVSPNPTFQGIDQVYAVWANIFPTTLFEISTVPPSHSMLVTSRELPQSDTGNYLCVNMKIYLRTTALKGVASFGEVGEITSEADVPVGAYLSGGLDSALTTTLARKWTNSSLKTFSLEFSDPRFDESIYQREMVNYLQTDHSSIRCTEKDIIDNIDDVIWATERPLLRTAPIPMFLLSKLVRSEKFKVVITGEGADEFFLGYDIFKEAKVREYCSRRPDSRIRPVLLGKLYPYLFQDPRTAKFQEAFFLQHFMETSDPFYGHRLRWNLNARIRDFYSPDMRNHVQENFDESLFRNLPSGFRAMPPLERTQMVEIETFLSGYLLSSQGDRMSMAHSVEGRFVFLDHELIEFASKISTKKKMQGLQEKHSAANWCIFCRKIFWRGRNFHIARRISSFLIGEKGREKYPSSLLKR